MFLSRWGRARRGEFARRLNLQFLEERVTPTTFVVSNLLDGPVSKAGDLPGSLRQAIFDANANPGADVVDATGVSGTIVLAAGELKVSDAVTISGPGAPLLTIDGNNKSRVISVFVPSSKPGYSAQINDVSIRGGKSTTTGGGINSDYGVNLELTDLVISNNEAMSSGGGLFCGSALRMQGCVVSANKSGGDFNGGGGIHCRNLAELTGCQFVGNTTNSYGGGAYFWTSALVDSCMFLSNHVTSSNGYGGGVYFGSTSSMSNCTLAENVAGHGGGAYFVFRATIADCTITDNQTTTGDGGGLFLGSHSTIDRSQILGNSSQNDGGGCYVQSGTVTFSNSTIAGNSTRSSYSSGGGIRSGYAVIRNCTIAQNKSMNEGGGLDASSAKIENSTIVGNTSAKYGGGIASASQLELVSSIVADNFGPATSPDIYCRGTAKVTDVNIGQLAGIAELQRSGVLITGSPMLGPLADNGGPTMTQLPLPNSPVRNVGSNPNGLTFDQRGQPRIVGAFVDLGAVESFDGVPTLRTSMPDILVAGSTHIEFSVRFDDPDGLKASSIAGNSNALRVVGPNGFDAAVQFLSIDATDDGPTRIATYRLDAPGGTFGPEDNGVYQVVAQPNQVFDLTGASVVETMHGDFRVHVPWTFVVTNTLDGPVTTAGDLPGSLRQAILDAAQTTTIDSIIFDSTVFGQATSIILTAGPLFVRDSVHIVGPGFELLTIDGNQSSRLFTIVPDANRQITNTKLSGLSLQNGRSSNGGAIQSTSIVLEIENCVIKSNQATTAGGGLHTSGTTLTLRNCEILNNQALNGAGGGIFMSNHATLDAVECTINDNLATGAGGGIYLWQTNNLGAIADISLEQTTVANNKALGTTVGWTGGGGVFISASASGSTQSFFGKLTIRNSVIAENFTGGGGGGLHLGYRDQLIMQNSTVTGNLAGRSGGGIYFYSDNGALIDNSTIDHNTAEGNTQYAKGGGGVQFWGEPSAIGWTIRNSTISSNTSLVAGGGVLVVTSKGLLNVQSSTITNNIAGTGGGGIAAEWETGTVSLSNSLIANNYHATTPDIISIGKVTADHSLIGVTDGIKTLTATKTLTGTLAAPLDPLLAPLADNGGPTKTHVPLPGSPAINRGSNPLNLEFDQRGPGYPRQAGVAADIGAFEFPLPPVVNAITIADGSAQRSMIRSLTVTFSEAVSFPAGPAAALQLQRTGPGGPTGLVNVVAEQIGNVVTLTFVDPVLAPSPGNSLMDGQYTLTLVSSKIHGTYATLDGNGDGIAGGDVVKSLHRLFGDSDGDGRVTAVDFNAFRQMWMTAIPVFDFNNDGVVSAVDFLQFRLRYGVTI